MAQKSQLVEVEYHKTFNLNGNKNITKYSFKDNGSASTYTNMGELQAGSTKSHRYSTPQVLYYNNEEKTVYNFSPIIRKEAITVEPNFLEHYMNWQLVEGSETILGYSCNKARLTFRGREYVAYYAKEIPISKGPYKFMGLPGIILRIASVDGMYTFEAVDIKISKKQVSIENPYKDSKLKKMSFDKNKKEMLEILAKMTKKATAAEKDSDISHEFQDFSLELTSL